MDTIIHNFDMPDDEKPESFIERLNSITELIAKRIKQPPVRMEPAYIFYGTIEQFESMSTMEILTHSSFLGYQECQNKQPNK